MNLVDIPVAPPSERVAYVSEDAKIRALMAWFNEHGGQGPAVSIRLQDGLRGVYTTERIAAGALILHIPRPTILTYQTVAASPIGQRLSAAKVKMDMHTYFAAYMIEVKRSGGFWHPFVDSLPESYDYLPMYYAAPDWALLKGSCVRRRALDTWRSIRGDYKKIRRIFDRKPPFSLREFIWARHASATRAYNMKLNSVETTGLVPVSDMFNHSCQAEADWLYDATLGFLVTAKGAIEAGRVIHESYGVRSNVQLLAMYGFCLEENPHDVVRIRVPKLLSSHPFHKGTQELGTVTESAHCFNVTRTYGADQARLLFSFLRMSCLADLPAACRYALTEKCDYKMVPPLSVENECGALRALTVACEERLRDFDDSLEHDLRVLARGELTQRQRYAIRVRSGEKRILHDYLVLAREAQGMLQLEPAARAENLAARAGAGPFKDYFEHLRTHLNLQQS